MDLGRFTNFLRRAHMTYGTDSEDMESAFAHGAAAALKTPFLAIRMISDSEWNHPEFKRSRANTAPSLR